MLRGDETRARILQAAEALFAKRGVAQTSLRAITAAARVNMAAVNYHFGSKESLAASVFSEVARRANTQRMELLDAARQRVAREGRRISLGEVIDCFIHPYLDDREPWTGLLLAHLVLTRRVNPQAWAGNAVSMAQFDEMAQRFIDALHEASGLTTAECYWRYYFMVSTMVLSVCDSTQSTRFVSLSMGECDPSDRDAMRREIRAFLVNGFGRAPDEATVAKLQETMAVPEG